MKKIPSDINQIGERIDSLRKKEAEIQKPQQESGFVYASKTGLRVGTELLSGVLVGACLGYFFDDFLGTKPLLLIIFLFLGGVAGFLNVYRFVRTQEQRRSK